MAANSGPVIFLSPALGESNDITLNQHPILGELPCIMCGKGTPNGDAAPFNAVAKGSLYLCMDNTDDASHLYQKVDEGGDDADWLIVPAS